MSVDPIRKGGGSGGFANLAETTVIRWYESLCKDHGITHAFFAVDDGTFLPQSIDGGWIASKEAIEAIRVAFAAYNALALVDDSLQWCGIAWEHHSDDKLYRILSKPWSCKVWSAKRLDELDAGRGRGPRRLTLDQVHDWLKSPDKPCLLKSLLVDEHHDQQEKVAKGEPKKDQKRQRPQVPDNVISLKNQLRERVDRSATAAEHAAVAAREAATAAKVAAEASMSMIKEVMQHIHRPVEAPPGLKTSEDAGEKDERPE